MKSLRSVADIRQLLFSTAVTTSLFAVCFMPLQSYADDMAAGETLYKSVCKNCHGPTAKGMASFPKLAGNSAEYLSTKLEQYRSGEKVGANTALMAPMAVNLSDEDIANLAAYISTSFK